MLVRPYENMTEKLGEQHMQKDYPQTKSSVQPMSCTMD
jgi:hypothetical protein